MEKNRTYPAINEKVLAQRKKLGLSETSVAHKANLSIYEYGDLESDPKELFMVVPVHHVKKVCNVLELNFFELFNISCAFCVEKKPYDDDYWLRRSALIRKRRQAANLSQEQLADRLGFYPKEVEMLEIYTAHLESWVLHNVLWLSELLMIPPQVLLDIQCIKCGR